MNLIDHLDNILKKINQPKLLTPQQVGPRPITQLSDLVSPLTKEEGIDRGHARAGRGWEMG